MKKILFYTNQFFGQIGGEDMAYAEPQLFEGMHGSANTFGAPLKDIAEIVATIVCGDNFYAENMETGRAFLLEQIKKYQPDLIIAGPAFNAGRFGIACGDVGWRPSPACTRKTPPWICSRRTCTSCGWLSPPPVSARPCP
mgnify:CR=1 FL=1